MKQYCFVNDLQEHLRSLKQTGKTIGFVPTMGALHEGHLSLISQSAGENDLTVCSIFVNPIQFNNRSDLEKYPRVLAADLAMLMGKGCDIVFTPDEREIYPDNRPEDYKFEFGELDKVLEGKYRPGHFKGVALVVKRLFEIVEPDKAYFGKKDYQQLLIIRRMVEQLNLPVGIIACPIVREADGLAMSSRNMRLTADERKIAPIIHQVLLQIKENSATMPLNELLSWGVKKIEETPGFQVEYFEVAESETLLPVTSWDQQAEMVLLAAVYLGKIRLIDNLELFCNFAP
ncbi:MAG: pantoate--beta-alanine ligase [Bacteroidota bacterium]